jgi:hypothetical protein
MPDIVYIRVRSKKFVTWFVVTPPQNATKCMFPESTCLKITFDTYLKFLFLAVAEKFLGKVDQFCSFFAFPAIHAFTKLVITFDGLNRFFRIIACFKGHSIDSVHPALFEIWNSTLLKNFWVVEICPNFKVKFLTNPEVDFLEKFMVKTRTNT